jgi:hypothetical protein
MGGDVSWPEGAPLVHGRICNCGERQKMSKLMILVVLMGWSCAACSGPKDKLEIRAGAQKQFESYDDLFDRGIPADDFSHTAFNLDGDVIQVDCYTKSSTKGPDSGMINSSVAKLTEMVDKLRAKYSVNLIYHDGDPIITVNNEPSGTGSIIRTVSLGRR